MTSKDILISQFKACYNEEVWFVPLTRALEGLTPEQATGSSEGENHSIRELVSHLIFWNERYLIRFRGEKPPPMEIENNAETFSDEIASIKGMDWGDAVERLCNVMDEWLVLLEKADDEKLGSIAIEGYEGIWYAEIANINIHNAYHVGQIVTLRKQQGLWKPEPEAN